MSHIRSHTCLVVMTTLLLFPFSSLAEPGVGSNSHSDVNYKGCTFYLLGYFDLNHDKRYTLEEGKQLGHLIAQRGGRVLTQMPEEVDYLVIGQNGPVIDVPVPGPDASPQEKRAYDEQVKRVFEYQRITRQYHTRGAVLLGVKPDATLFVVEGSDFRPRPSSQPSSGAVAQLNQQIPNAQFNQIQLSDIFEFIRDITQANIVVHWPSLQAAGIAKDTLISLRLKQVPVGAVLKYVLRQASPKLDYVIDQQVIHVDTREGLYRRVESRPYNIYQLARAVAEQRGMNASEAKGYISNVIRHTIDPQSWKRIDPANARHEPRSQTLKELIMFTQTSQNHAAIGQVLNRVSGQQKGEGIAESNAERATRVKLSTSLPELNCQDLALTDVLTYMRDRLNVNIVLDHSALKQVGGEQASKVTLKLNNIRADQAINLVMESVSPQHKLGWLIDENGIVFVSSRQALQRETVLRVYRIARFLRTAKGQNYARQADSLCESIRQSIDTPHWRPADGPAKPEQYSALAELNGWLIINTTRSNHAAILKLLMQQTKLELQSKPTPSTSRKVPTRQRNPLQTTVPKRPTPPTPAVKSTHKTIRLSAVKRRYELAEMYLRAGQKALAVKEYNAIIDQYPDSEVAAKAKKRLEELKP